MKTEWYDKTIQALQLNGKGERTQQAYARSVRMLTQFYDRDTTPPMAERGMDSFTEFWANPNNVDPIMDRLDEKRKEFFSGN